MEEERSELNDILIKSRQGRNKFEFKNLLLMIAISFLLFFIGVLFYKVLYPDDSELIAKIEQANQQQMIIDEGIKAKKSIFEDIPSQDLNQQAYENIAMSGNEANNLDAMIQKIKEEQDRLDAPQPNDQKPMDKVPENKAAKITQANNSTEKQIKPVTKDLKQANQEVPTEEVPTTIIPAVKATKDQTKSKNKPKIPVKINKKPLQKTFTEDIIPKGFYIQVGSFSKVPNKTFLNRISANKLPYKIVDRTINNLAVKRIYIGPYKLKKDAYEQLNIIRTRINSDAYIFRER